MGGSSAGVFTAAAAPSTSMGTDSSLTGAAGLEYTSYNLNRSIFEEDKASYGTKINVLGRKKSEKLILRRRCRVEDEQTVKNLNKSKYFPRSK